MGLGTKLAQGVKGLANGRPASAVAAGALMLSASAILIDLAGTTPGTASFFRSFLAWLVLLPLAGKERLLEPNPLARRQRVLALVAGALFAGDMLLWTAAIAEVGAGLSTVVVNVQVAIVPLLAFAIDRERLPGRFLVALPVLLVGVTLTGGVLDEGTTGSNPSLGTVHAVLAALCYSGFLYLLRRIGQSAGTVQTYRDVSLAAAVTSLLAGLAWQGVDLWPGWTTFAWLAAVTVTGQLLGWLLVAIASPRLASHVSATLLLLTPVGALLLGALVLGERPSPLQLLGCALILAAGYFATATRGRESRKQDTRKS